MGRVKIDIKLIENVNSRQVTFSKRRSGLLKKAQELSILCDAEVAVIIFSSTDKPFEYSSTSMKHTLSRYNKCVNSSKPPTVEKKLKEEHNEVEVLNNEISKLKSKQLQLLGKDLTDMGLNELRQLEHELDAALLAIKGRKEQLPLEQLEHSRQQEERALQENENLRRQIEELRGLYPSTISPPIPQHYLEYYPTQMTTFSSGKDGAESHNTACDGDFENEVSDTSLQLGPPTGSCQKRKTSEQETRSCYSENHLELKCNGIIVDCADKLCSKGGISCKMTSLTFQLGSWTLRAIHLNSP